ncbi:MAG: DUF721 domain-containing protein [Oceanipulchritudo sp.]
MNARFSREAEQLIASLRSLPDDPSSETGTGAKPLDSLLEACVEKYHIGKNTPEETILENWNNIVGPAFSARCRPERIDASGALVVRAGNATVRRELIFMEERILTALGSLPGCQDIHRVVLKSGV